MLIDFGGCRPIANTGEKETDAERRWSMEQMKDSPLTRLKGLGITFKPNSDGRGGELTNSYRLTNGKKMRELADYLLNHSSFSPYLAGSVEGFVHEWDLHNVAYKYGKLVGDKDIIKRARNLDIGMTIYDDDHGLMSSIMRWLYVLKRPRKAGEDKRIYDSLN